MVGDYRRVYVSFNESRGKWPDLTWSHFRMAMRLPEADQRAALDWAQAEGATCKAMVDFAACRNLRDLSSDCIVEEFAELLDEELEACDPAAGLN